MSDDNLNGAEQERHERKASLQRQREKLQRTINYLEETILVRPADVELKVQLGDAREELERIGQELEGTPFGPPPPEAPPPNFTGRESYLAELEETLTKPQGELVALTALQGLGGIGKTATALVCTHRLREHFPTGIYWAELGQNPDVLTIMSRWAQWAGGDVSGESEAKNRAATVRMLLARRLKESGLLLIVLDDAWDIEPVRVLLAARPSEAPVLLTTRDSTLARRLDFNLLRLDALPEDEALDLLKRLLPGGIDCHENSAKKLVEHLGGLPLALKLAAGQIESADELPWLLGRLEKGAGLKLLRLGSGRSESVADCFALSYQALDADMQRRFRDLGVFAEREPFSVAAAASVWGEGEGGAEDSLRFLLRRALLERVEVGAYCQHMLLHEYALALLQEQGEWPEAARRHALYYLAFAKEAHWQEVEATLGQIRAGRQAAQSLDDKRLVLDYANVLYTFLERRGLWDENLIWTEEALSAARVLGERKDEGVLLNNIGAIYRLKGLWEDALRYFEQSRAIREEIGDRAGSAQALNNIGYIYQRKGLRDDALNYYEQSRIVHDELGDKAGLAQSLNNIGEIYRVKGALDEALHYYEQSYIIHDKLGDKAGIAMALNNIGGVYRDKGSWDEALHCYEQSCTIRKETGDRTGLAVTLNNIGGIYRRKELWDEALRYYQQSRVIHEELGNRLELAWVLNDIGYLYYRRGFWDEALSHHEQSRIIKEEIGNRLGLAVSLNNIGLVYCRKRLWDEALYYLKQSCAIREEMGHRVGLPVTLNNIGWVYQSKGDWDEALRYYEQSRVICEEINYKSRLVDSLNNIGQVYQAKSSWNEALRYYEQSRAICEEIGYRDQLATTLSNIATLRQEQGEYRAAVELLERVVTIREELGHPDLEESRAALERTRELLASEQNPDTEK